MLKSCDDNGFGGDTVYRAGGDTVVVMMVMVVVMKWRKSAMEKADREEKVPKSRGGGDATSSMQLGPIHATRNIQTNNYVPWAWQDHFFSPGLNHKNICLFSILRKLDLDR